MKQNEAYDWCKSHMYRYVSVQTTDGFEIDGIIEQIESEHLYLAVPISEGDRGEFRVFPYPLQGAGLTGPGYPGYGFPGPVPGGIGPVGIPGYPGYPGYPVQPGYPGYGPYHRRRFYRQILPLAALVGLALLPYY